MSRAKKISNPKFGAKVVEFLNIAYKDYLGARVLLNAGLLSQGAVLSSTAIEKYFKAILAFRGNEAPGHLSKRHINSAKNYDKNLATALNDDFLTLLQRAYQLRYLDNLPKEFNIVIADREFLAELDYTAILIQESFRMQLNGQETQSIYHLDKLSNDQILFENNYILTKQAKQHFIAAAPQNVYEIRNCKLRGFLEVSYMCTARESDRNFLREGFKAVPPEYIQYQMSLPPLYQPDHAA